ncbi:hypothetical protein SAMN02927929_01399 [Pseudomonas flexibilis]|nr:hypothetical protein SAMN02927929_01399 [Pseudomonas flexibilis]
MLPCKPNPEARGFSRHGREHRGLPGNRKMAAGKAPAAPNPP